MIQLKKLTIATGFILPCLLTLCALPVQAITVDRTNLIDDQVFDSSGTMTAAQIDNFLNAFPDSCISSNSTFRTQDPVGYNPSDGFKYGSNVTAGKAIYNAAKAYDLNPQVLLTLIQREQGLVTGGSGCSKLRYVAAVGFNCPDSGTGHNYSGINLYTLHGTTVTSVTGTCAGSSSTVGFTRQIIHAAWRLTFDRHRSEGKTNWAIIKTNWDNSDDLESCYYGRMTQGTFRRCPSGPATYYDGYATIDNTSIHLDNGATAALYNYTPHLSGGTSFVTVFSTWFGSTHAVYTRLDTPRWMATATSTYKKDPATDTNTDQAFPSGTQLYFVDKIKVNGVTYMRTSSDSRNVRNQGIPLTDLTEIAYQPLSTPRYMQLTTDVYKMNPRTGQPNKSHVFKQGETIKIKDKINVNGSWYFRSEYDTNLGVDMTIDAAHMTEVPYSAFTVPRYLLITRNTTKVNPVTGVVDAAVISKDAQIKFASKMLVGGNWYYRTANDTTGDAALAIPASNIQDIPYQAISPTPKWMRLVGSATKVNPRADTTTTESLAAGMQLQIASQITVNGVAYLRTMSDTHNSLDKGIVASNFEDIPYTSLETPEWLQTRTSITKRNPRHGFRVGSTVPKGTQLQVTQQITINGALYYRTAYDTTNNLDTAVRASDLQDVPYVALDKPRYLYLSENTSKYIPKIGTAIDGSSLSQGSALFFSSKVNINGQWYLRTKSDTAYNRNQGIPLTSINL